MSNEFLEKYTFEYLLNDALSRVLDTLDKRQGSIIYNAIAPACYELATAYLELKNVMDQTFVGSATVDNLDEKVSEVGLTRESATNAVKKGVFDINITLGDRFSGGGYTYITVEKIQDYQFKLQCEQPGTQGNDYLGQILPITYIDGLQTATLTETIVVARDTETDEELRERFFTKVSQEAVDGNIAQYEAWCRKYAGIGNELVYPLWNGVNTVKVSILNEDMGVASAELVAAFQAYLDPGAAGLGNGVAPIGAHATVSTATETEISISASVRLASGYSEVTGLEAELLAWFRAISYETSTVNFYEVAAHILSNASISQIVSILVNGASADIALAAEHIPVLGTLTVEVVE